MAKTYNYEKLQKLRDLIISEMRESFPTMTTEHYMLVEMRLQSVIMAGLDDTDVKGKVRDPIK